MPTTGHVVAAAALGVVLGAGGVGAYWWQSADTLLADVARERDALRVRNAAYAGELAVLEARAATSSAAVGRAEARARDAAVRAAAADARVVEQAAAHTAAVAAVRASVAPALRAARAARAIEVPEGDIVPIKVGDRDGFLVSPSAMVELETAVVDAAELRKQAAALVRQVDAERERADAEAARANAAVRLADDYKVLAETAQQAYDRERVAHATTLARVADAGTVPIGDKLVWGGAGAGAGAVVAAAVILGTLAAMN